MPIIKSGRLLPSLSKISFLNRYPEEINHGKKRRVAIFIGCLANYNYTNIGDSLIEILKELKIDCLYPKRADVWFGTCLFTGDSIRRDLFKDMSIGVMMSKDISRGMDADKCGNI